MLVAVLTIILGCLFNIISLMSVDAEERWSQHTNGAKSKLCNWIFGLARNRWPCGYQNRAAHAVPHLNKKKKQTNKCKINNHDQPFLKLWLDCFHLWLNQEGKGNKCRGYATVAWMMQGQDKLWAAEGKKTKLKQSEIVTQKNALCRRRHRGKQKRWHHSLRAGSSITRPRERHTGVCVGIRHMILLTNGKQCQENNVRTTQVQNI